MDGKPKEIIALKRQDDTQPYQHRFLNAIGKRLDCEGLDTSWRTVGENIEHVIYPDSIPIVFPASWERGSIRNKNVKIDAR